MTYPTCSMCQVAVAFDGRARRRGPGPTRSTRLGRRIALAGVLVIGVAPFLVSAGDDPEPLAPAVGPPSWQEVLSSRADAT